MGCCYKFLEVGVVDVPHIVHSEIYFVGTVKFEVCYNNFKFRYNNPSLLVLIPSAWVLIIWSILPWAWCLKGLHLNYELIIFMLCQKY